MSDECRQWFHDVRNAINTIGITASIVNRLLAEGKYDQAQEMMKGLEETCDRCRELMKKPPGGF